MEQNLSAFCEIFLKLQTDRVPMVVVTMTGSRGDAPQDTGARMIVGESGILFGTVGGGKIERRCLDQAQEFLKAKKHTPPQSFTWNLQRDIGMTCGGEVTMFFEVQRSLEEWQIAIFGAGHLSQELTRVLLRLDCHLTVIDPRRDWLEKLPESPRLTKIETAQMADVLTQLPDHTFVVLMTMGHATDSPVLARALKEKSYPYLGVIGSPTKRLKLESEMKAQGVSSERAKDFFCPMGETIGSNAPAEIAISITAQLLKVRGALS